MSAHARRPVLAIVSLLALCGPWGATAADAASTPAAISVATHGRTAVGIPDGGDGAAVDPAGCDVVRFYVAVNPSMNKPRSHQDRTDHWSWASAC